MLCECNIQVLQILLIICQASNAAGTLTISPPFIYIFHLDLF